MRITVPFPVFASAFKLAASTAGRGLPILQQVRVRAFADANLAELTATDNESRLDIQLAGVSVEEGGVTMLDPGKVKVALAAGKGADIVTIEGDASGSKIKVGGQTYGTKGDDPLEFPDGPALGPEVGAIRCETALLAFGLKTALVAVSTDDGRPNLTGVFFAAEGGRLTLVATDGHRMGKTAFPAEVSTAEERLSVIVPKAGVELIQDIVTGFDTEIAVYGGDVQVTTPAIGNRGQVTLRVRLIDASFPDYTRVIPSPQPDKAITVASSDLCEAVDVIAKTEIALTKDYEKSRKPTDPKRRSALIFATDGTPGLKIFGETVSALTPDDFQMAVVSSDARQAGAVTVGFNEAYWLDLCKVIEEPSYSLQIIDALSPVVIRPTDEPADLDTLYIIMPLRT